MVNVKAKCFKWILLILFAAIIILPIWFLAVASLRQSTLLMEYPPKLWPNDATLQNYKDLLDPQRYQFGRWFVNSLIVAVFSTIGTIFICSLAGYAFAKKEFVGKSVLFTIALSTMMIPATVTLLPIFLIIRDLGLTNTHAGIILPCFGAAFGVFLMRQFVSTIPSSLEESARIDGCSEFRIYWSIILPITAPALSVLGIYTFMNQWNNLIWPLIITTSESMKTLPVGIAGMRSETTIPWGLMMAASFLSFIPIFIVFLFAREKFVEGLTAGAIKG